MPDADIRLATSDDADALVHLNDAVQRLHAEAHPGQFLYPPDSQAIAAFFLDHLKTPNHRVLVATIAGRLVGYVLCLVQRRAANAFRLQRAVVMVDQLAVVPEHRRHGVGRRLMEAVEAFAREQKIAELTLTSWSFNQDAHRFFARMGYAPSQIVMGKMLSG